MKLFCYVVIIYPDENDSQWRKRKRMTNRTLSLIAHNRGLS